MSVEITPRGTKGARLPAPAPLKAIFVALSDLAFRLLRDRMRVQGRPVLRLETIGARSGARRHAVLCWFPEREDSWLIVASLGGSPRHPDWFHNLARNPDRVWIEVAQRRWKVRPESLRGAEREEAWRRIVAFAPGYAGYQEKTDRIIPVVRLVRVSPG